MAVCKCVHGTVARVVYSRFFPDWTNPQTGRLNKSPHTIHAFANRQNCQLFSKCDSPRRQTDFLFIFQFSIFHITFVIYHCRSRLGRAMVYDKRNMENETTKAPPSVVHLSPCATRHLARPAILLGNDDLFDTEIFPAKPDLHRPAIQRDRAFDRQRGAYLSWRPRRTVMEGASLIRLEHQTCSTHSSSVGAACP
jgi:hypothetical protein